MTAAAPPSPPVLPGNQPPAPPPTPAPAAAPTVKIAGKYDNAEKFVEGYVALSGKLGVPLPATTKLYGEGGLFKDEASAVVGYKGLESTLGRLAPAKPADPNAPALAAPKDTPKEGEGEGEGEPEAVSDQSVSALMTELGLDGNLLAEAWKKDGKLPADAYKKLNGKGYKTQAINEFMSGQEARAELYRRDQADIKADAIKIVGSWDQIQNLLVHMKQAQGASTDSLEKAELADIEQRLLKKATYRSALRDLQAHHAASMNSGGSRAIAEGGNAINGGGGAKNSQEFNELYERARRGDTGALARIQATTQESIKAWGPKV